MDCDHWKAAFCLGKRENIRLNLQRSFPVMTSHSVICLLLSLTFRSTWDYCQHQIRSVVASCGWVSEASEHRDSTTSPDKPFQCCTTFWAGKFFPSVSLLLSKTKLHLFSPLCVKTCNPQNWNCWTTEKLKYWKTQAITFIAHFRCFLQLLLKLTTSQ